MKNRNLIFIFIILLSGCIEAFDPEIDDYEDILVVDGILSDEKIPVRVYLSRTYAYDDFRNIPEQGALVSLVNEEGISYTLDETDDGYYTYELSDFTPRAGSIYQLHILTSDGLEFASDFQEMLVAPSLDSLYYKDYRKNPEGSFVNVEGVDVYISSSNSLDDSRYYKWEWEESWKILPAISYPSVKYCWQNDVSRGIRIATTESLSENQIENQFLFSIPFTLNKLAVQYSVQVKQYTLTRNDYVYLSKLEKINKGFGGFFDPIPAALAGNMQCISDPSIPVLGIFVASSVETKRIFINREDLKPGFIATGFEDCEIIYRSYEDYQRGLIRDYYYVFHYFDTSLNDTIAVMTNQRKCYDCSYVGDPYKPSFWPE